MHRIDHETATSDHKFTEGNPTIPVPATVVTDDWLNAVQEELVAAITGAGLELEKSDNTQLWQAISQTITTAVDNARPGLATKKKPGLVQIGDGLAITPEGLLSVLIASTSQAGLVKPRYGLKIGKDGSLDVDFGDMPTDKFEELLKSIRVPIWVDRTKYFYVNQNTGSDVLDDGRGETEGKPFKTIQACVDYVSTNYNVNKWPVGIRVSAGRYNERLKLGEFTRTTGSIAIISYPNDYAATLILDENEYIVNATGGYWILRGFVYELTAHKNEIAKFPETSGIVSADKASVVLDGYDISASYEGSSPEYSRSLKLLTAFNGGVIYMSASSKARRSINFSKGDATELSVFVSGSGGEIRLTGSNNSQDACTLTVSGDCTNFAGAYGGKIIREDSTIYKCLIQGTVTGKRYMAFFGGSINTTGGGAEFFPGTEAGTVSDVSCSWYL